MRREAARVDDQRASTRLGIVSSFDPTHYAVKVRIQPEDIETGWLPVGTAWSGNGWGLFAPPSPGDMVELQFQEDDRDAGLVAHRFFSDKDRPLPAASGEFWLVHKSGSLLKFHNDGSVELTSDTNLTATVGGTLQANVTGDMTATIGGNVSASVSGGATLNVTGQVNGTASRWNLTGDVYVTGSINVTGNAGIVGTLSADNGATQASGGNLVSSGNVNAVNLNASSNVSDSHNTLAHLRATYNVHFHNTTGVGAGPISTD
jgi:hypothetical protein